MYDTCRCGTLGTMFPTIPLTDGVLISDRDIRVSVTLTPMILAEDLSDVVVEGRTASVAGSLGASAGPLPRTWSPPVPGLSRTNGLGRADDSRRLQQPVPSQGPRPSGSWPNTQIATGRDG